MKLSACNLGKEIDDLTYVVSGKYSIVHVSAEAAVDKNYLTMLIKCNPLFQKEIVAMKNFTQLKLERS